MLQVYEILGQESRKEQGIKQTGRNPQFPPLSLSIHVNIPLLENKIIGKIRIAGCVNNNISLIIIKNYYI